MTGYSVTDCFWTIQGEGLNAGMPSVFIRFAGCNLWNGIPGSRHRGKGACAQWCDTYFAKGQRFTAEGLADEVHRVTGNSPDETRVVLSGGEPCLQIDEHLMGELLARFWYVAVETNGSIDNPALKMADHVCVSYKLGAEQKVLEGSECKIILPGELRGKGWTDEELEDLFHRTSFERYYVQPQDPPLSAEVEDTYLHPRSRQLDTAKHEYVLSVRRCMQFLRRNPHWRLSVQGHKVIGVP